MDRNGVCKKNVEGTKRLHTIVKKVDGFGREFSACDKCGFVQVVKEEYPIPKK